MDTSEKIQKITELKEQKNVTILAHYYQRIDVHKIADFVGDSLALARLAKDKVDTPNIILAGVQFMAETAAILNPEKKVFHPNYSEAGCPLADYLDPSIIEKYRKKYPEAPLVVYVNTTAETKARADVCCTSSNAVKIVRKIAEERDVKRILFGPDNNLAAYVGKNCPDLEIIAIPQGGNCPYHNLFTLDDVNSIKKDHPNATLLLHPESPPEVQEIADGIGSTAFMRKYVESSDDNEEIILGTENGLLEFLKWKYPEKHLYKLSERAICEGMKSIDLDDILNLLESIGTENEREYLVEVNPEISEKAVKSIEKMLNYS